MGGTVLFWGDSGCCGRLALISGVLKRDHQFLFRSASPTPSLFLFQTHSPAPVPCFPRLHWVPSLTLLSS